jgi:hypothetical protein
MPKFQEKLLTRFVTSCGAAFCLREAHSCILAGNHIRPAEPPFVTCTSPSVKTRGWTEEKAISSAHRFGKGQVTTAIIMPLPLLLLHAMARHQK